MAYEIRIKGDRNSLIVESNSIGEKIRQDFFDYKLKKKPDNIFTVAGFSGTLSCIGSIKMVSSLKSENKASDNFYREANNTRMDYLKLSSEERAKRMGFFRLFYWSFTKMKSEEVFLESGKCIEELAYSIQKKFFEENPKRTFCDPVFFHPIVKSKKADASGIGLIERITREDYQLSLK